jgi:hypothetical protein
MAAVTIGYDKSNVTSVPTYVLGGHEDLTVGWLSEQKVLPFALG